MVEDRHPERGQPAIYWRPAVDASFDGDAAFNPAIYRRPAVDASFNREAAFNRFQTVDWQPPIERLHAIDELPQP